jgi:hypothetical protein
VPGVENPMAWNRYGYVLHNPLKYTDPSGHWTSKKQFLEIFVGTLQDREIGLGGEKINIGRFGDHSNSGLREITSYPNSFPVIELPSIQIKVDDWEDFLIDILGIVGDTLPMIAITTDVVGFLPDDLLVPFVWITAEGAEFIQATSTIAEFSKGIHDFIIEGDYENLHDAVQSATVQQLLEITDNTGIYKFGKLIPVVGIGFNLYDLNKNVNIEINYLED